MAAAVLSDRYVTGRFLPDKAIDLMDEAASRLRIEIDSMPTELDVVTRRLRQLEIERMALAKETDPASAERLARLDEEMANLTEESSAMTAHWQSEKEAITTIQSLKGQLEQRRSDAERLGREGNLAEASEITYGVVPDLERQIEVATAALDELQKSQRFLKEEVDAEDVAEVVSRATGVPVSRLLEGEVEKLVRMEDALHARVVGQDEAVSAVSNAIRRSRAGLSNPDRPIGSFLFMGPTGVGKTELARALAEFLFDDAKAMIRIDMGEYGERHSVARLVGAPPGYVGYEEGGQLTEAIRRRPYAVVLLDELEKAHPDVFNILLQVLEDGRLTDGQGRTVDFTNTVLIMTSNIPGEPIQHFKPEFVNRIDEIVRFQQPDRGRPEPDRHDPAPGPAFTSGRTASVARGHARCRDGAGPQRLRSRLRGPSAPQGDPAPGGGSTRPRAAGGPLSRRVDGHRGCRGRHRRPRVTGDRARVRRRPGRSGTGRGHGTRRSDQGAQGRRRAADVGGGQRAATQHRRGLTPGAVLPGDHRSVGAGHRAVVRRRACRRKRRVRRRPGPPRRSAMPCRPRSGCPRSDRRPCRSSASGTTPNGAVPGRATSGGSRSSR